MLEDGGHVELALRAASVRATRRQHEARLEQQLRTACALARELAQALDGNLE